MHLRNSSLGALLGVFTASACVGDIGVNDKNKKDGDGELPAFAPAEATIHRLTAPQVQNTYVALLGEPLVVPTELPNDDVLYGFTSISAAGSTISSLDAEKYENAAYDVLDQVWADAPRRASLVGCEPAAAEDPCVRDFFEQFMMRAWRRPIDAPEVDGVLGVVTDVAADLGDPNLGIKYGVAAVLQSPSFLFRVEIGEPDPERTELLRFTSWEMASRLSYLLTDGPPDDDLTLLAATGALVNPDTVAAQAARLVDDPRARPALLRFFGDFMNLTKLDTLDKDPDKFPAFSAALGPAMRTEIERMFELVVFEKQGDFRQLFTTRDTYINEELAKVYGIGGVTGPEFRPYTLPEGERAGVLTTPGFLALNAHKTQTSPTHRGRFIRLNLLCQEVPPPPPGVDTSLPDTPGQTLTLRQRLEVHRENDQCRSCHAMMDPMGFALENFDAVGTFRTVDENGLPIDAVSEVDGSYVGGPNELGPVVAQLPQVGACVARRFYEHAGGHVAVGSEEVAIEALVEGFVTTNYDFKQLVVALVTNEGFRYTTSPAAE